MPVMHAWLPAVPPSLACLLPMPLLTVAGSATPRCVHLLDRPPMYQRLSVHEIALLQCDCLIYNDRQGWHGLARRMAVGRGAHRHAAAMTAAAPTALMGTPRALFNRSIVAKRPLRPFLSTSRQAGEALHSKPCCPSHAGRWRGDRHALTARWSGAAGVQQAPVRRAVRSWGLTSPASRSSRLGRGGARH